MLSTKLPSMPGALQGTPPAPGAMPPAPAAPAGPSFADRLQRARAQAPRHEPAPHAREAAPKPAATTPPAAPKPAPGTRPPASRPSDAAARPDQAARGEPKKAADDSAPADEETARPDDRHADTDAAGLGSLLPGWTAATPAAAAVPDGKGAAVDAPALEADAVGAGAQRGAAARPGAGVAGDAALAGGADTANDTAPRTEARFSTTLAAAEAHADRVADDHAPAPAGTATELTAGVPLPAPATGAAAHAGPAAPAAPAPFDARLSAALGSPDFGPALGVQVTILAREGVQEARLHLNPADMGPIAVQIAVDGQNAQVHFQADVAATRQALESSLPDLAAALREGGFTLSGGGVSQQQRDGARGGDAAPGSGPRTGRGSAAGDEAAPAVNAARPLRRQGVVDLYA